VPPYSATSAPTTARTYPQPLDKPEQREIVIAEEEVDGFFFRLSWAELTILVVFLISFVAASFLGAMAAEMSVSIHYFDQPAPRSFQELDRHELEMTYHRLRITLIDPDMAAANRHVTPILSSNTRSLNKLRLQRVIDVKPSGHSKTMLVVEESPMESIVAANSGGNERRRMSYDGSSTITTTWRPPPPNTPVEESIQDAIHPKLCADGATWGFDSWSSLRSAIHLANKLSVEQFVRWSRFFADHEEFSGIFQDDSLYYEQEIVIRICPRATLRARHGPIFINAPNLILECDKCTVSIGSSHFSFGPNAKNVLIRGITFTKAWASSLVFFHNGAEVALENCNWLDNSAAHSRLGAVADINSTSTVNFYRCNIDAAHHRGENDLASSLSIRA
jgi:hypothetical protein